MDTNTTDLRENFVRLVTSECIMTLTYSSTVCTISYWIATVRPYVLLVLGIIGNLVNIFTLLRKRLRKSSTSVYLMFLAGADILSVTTTPPWTTELQNLSDFHCKWVWFVINVTGITGAWLNALVVIERMVFLKFPIFARTRNTWKTALISCLTTLGFVILFNFHYLIGNELITNTLTSSTNRTQTISKVCFSSFTSYQQFRIHIWPILFLVFAFVLPMGIIIVASVITINGLRWRSRHLAAVDQSRNMSSDVRRDRRDASITRMMMIVSSYSIITTLPFCIYQICINIVPPLTNQNDEFQAHVLILAILFVLVTSNYVSNCVFYFCCGTQFRREWKEIIKSVKSKMRTIYAGENVIHVADQATEQRLSTTSKTYTNQQTVSLSNFVDNSIEVN